LTSIFYFAFPGCFKLIVKKRGYNCGHKHDRGFYFSRNEAVLVCADWSQETIMDRGFKAGMRITAEGYATVD
jgi:hypothetical protein